MAAEQTQTIAARVPKISKKLHIDDSGDTAENKLLPNGGAMNQFNPPHTPSSQVKQPILLGNASISCGGGILHEPPAKRRIPQKCLSPAPRKVTPETAETTNHAFLKD